MPSTTLTVSCTLRAAERYGRETHDITVDRDGEVSAPDAIRERLFHSDQRVADAARRDVIEAACEALAGVGLSEVRPSFQAMEESDD